jgi:hypothetical protein
MLVVILTGDSSDGFLSGLSSLLCLLQGNKTLLIRLFTPNSPLDLLLMQLWLASIELIQGEPVNPRR